MRGPGSLPAWMWMVLLGGPLLAGEPELNRVWPARGFVDRATELTLQGEGFEPGMRAGLLDGGPYSVSQSATWGWTEPAVASGGLLASISSGVQCHDWRGCESWAHLTVHDIGDPAQPASIDGITLCSEWWPIDEPGRFCGAPPVAVHGRHVLAPSTRYPPGGVSETELRVFEVTDAGTVLQVGSMDLPGGISGLAVSGNRGCLRRGGTIHVLDLDDPTQPEIVAASEMPGKIEEFAMAGRHAYRSVRAACGFST